MDDGGYQWLYPSSDNRNVTATIDQFVMGGEERAANNNVTTTTTNNNNNNTRGDRRKKTSNVKQNFFYTIPVKVPKISTKTYFDIAYNVINKRNLKAENIERCLLNFKFLKFTQKNEVTRACLKKIARVSSSVCPKCRHVNCWRCCGGLSAKKKKKDDTGKKCIIVESVLMSCFNCHNVFRARAVDENSLSEKLRIYAIRGFQSKKCQLMYKDIYKEFSRYIKWKRKMDKRYHYELHNKSNNKKLLSLYNALTPESKKDLKYRPDNLNYCLRVSLVDDNNNNNDYDDVKKKREKRGMDEDDDKKAEEEEENEEKERGEKGENKRDNNRGGGNNNNSVSGGGDKKKKRKKNKEMIKIIPPMIFFLNRRKTMSFFKKMLTVDSTMAIKTRYGSVFSRGSGGKTNIFRTMCCNRRHVLSARIVIVPRYQLKPHECILPFSIFCRLGCPKFVLCHRYPTLDLKSMTFHSVRGTWQYPSMAISTSIVAGNNADFDGDCLHVIPATSLISQSELFCLLHPAYNVICQDKLRVMFDHDERQTLYSLFGLDANEIHDGLRAMAENEGSQKTYEYFCKLKSLCNFTWQTKTINTISCKDFLDMIPRRPMSYIKYRNDYYAKKIPNHNGIKEMIESKASRFSFDHAWQLFGEISQDAPVGFLSGMEKNQFIKVAKGVRNNLVSEISLYGYTIIKLTHCTKSITIGYDGRVYTTDGVLVALNVKDLVN